MISEYKSKKRKKSRQDYGKKCKKSRQKHIKIDEKNFQIHTYYFPTYQSYVFLA